MSSIGSNSSAAHIINAIVLTVSFIADPIMAVSTETYTTGVESSLVLNMKARAHNLI